MDLMKCHRCGEERWDVRPKITGKVGTKKGGQPAFLCGSCYSKVPGRWFDTGKIRRVSHGKTVTGRGVRGSR